jgi:hypothetical protein
MRGSRGRYTGGTGATWVVPPSARTLARRSAWSARAGMTRALVPTNDAHADIGASIWQTPGGVQSELERINSDFDVFATEIAGFLSARGYPTAVAAVSRPLIDLFQHVWTPLLNEWRSFFSKNKGWWGNFWWNHAPEAEQFLAQLVQVRAKARELGMTVLSPTPSTFVPSILFDPTRNVFDRAADGAQKAVTDVWKVVKFALYGGVAIAGGVAIFALVRTVKTGVRGHE